VQLNDFRGTVSFAGSRAPMSSFENCVYVCLKHKIINEQKEILKLRKVSNDWNARNSYIL